VAAYSVGLKSLRSIVYVRGGVIKLRRTYRTMEGGDRKLVQRFFGPKNVC